MSRCEICNFSDVHGSDCIEDVGDVRPKRCSVHYYKDLNQDLCTYCHKIVTKNRKFYSWFFRPKEALNDKNEVRPKQKDKKTTPKVPEMSEQ